jgi:UDP-glucose 4-epimerase
VHLNLLDTVAKNNPEAVLFFPSSQLVYGRPQVKVITEDHPTNPTSLYGANKLLIEKYNRIFFETKGLKVVTFRISNPYGELTSGQPKPNYGLVNYFIHLASKGETIKIFGEGHQRRTYLYIHDLVDAILQVVDDAKSFGEVFNVGGSESVSIIDMANMVVRTVGKGRIEKQPWPEKAAKIEVGDLQLDISKIQAKIGWSPKVSLKQGIINSYGKIN